MRMRGNTQARDPTLDLKPKAEVTRRSKQGYQWPHERDLCLSKSFKKTKMDKYVLIYLTAPAICASIESLILEEET